MKQNSQIKNEERREFIKKSTLVGAGVVAATLVNTEVIADVGETKAEKPAQKGYQLTQHVVDYYKSADI